MTKVFGIGNTNAAGPLNYVTSVNTLNSSFNGVSLPPELANDTVTFDNSKLTAGDLASWDAAVSQICRYKFENLSAVKNLSEDERYELRQHLNKHRDQEAFLFVATGGRPAMGTCSIPLLDKLSDDFDVIPLCDISSMIFNKSEMIKKIDENRELFLNRLNLSKEASNEEIYATFTAKNGPLYNIINAQDLVGVSFGYPVIDSIIFQLEADADMRQNIIEHRSNLVEYKTKLIDALYAENSKYSSFDDAFKYKVEKAIKSINTIKASTECGYPDGYLFIKFTNNPIDDVENVKKIKNSIQELDKINKKTAKEQEKQQVGSLDSTDFLAEMFKIFNSFLNEEPSV